MKVSTSKRGGLRLIALFAAVFAQIAACSSGSDNPKPPDHAFTTGVGVGGGPSGGTNGSSSGEGGGLAECTDPKGCYKCPPKTSKQFLNACTDAQCAPFDNAKRLPLYNSGNLPPVP